MLLTVCKLSLCTYILRTLQLHHAPASRTTLILAKPPLIQDLEDGNEVPLNQQHLENNLSTSSAGIASHACLPEQLPFDLKAGDAASQVEDYIESLAL